MLIFAMSVSVDGFVADRAGGIGWAPAPSDELFAVHLERVRSLDAYLLGRRLYETMRGWETDPAMRATPLQAAFAAAWTALPKVVFSRSPYPVEGNARMATRALVDEVAAATADGRRAEIGGPTLAADAVAQGLVDEFHVFRVPVIVGGGTPYLPPLDAPTVLDLAETRSFDGSVVFERFRVTR